MRILHSISKMFRALLMFILCCFPTHFINCGVIQSDNDEGELLLVSVIFRHGARTTYSFYPSDPYQKETFYPFGKGQLTNEGKLGEFKLGKYLKSLYGDFLGEDYTEEKVYIRSTDVSRTKMSAQLVLAGLFPPSESLKWNTDLLWIPIPVSYKSDSEEDLFHPTSNCNYKKASLNDLPNIPEVRDKFIEPFLSTYEYIEKHSGKSIKVPSDIQDFYFILKSEDDMNYTLPIWTQEVYPDQVDKLASYVYTYHNYDPEVKKINAGYMLKKILDDSFSKIDNNSSDRKIYLYSGHESTIGYMLDAIKNVEETVPAYGSAISFELRHLNSNYYIKLSYRNDTEATTPINLTIPGCDVMCPIDTFKELLSEVIPTKTIQKACAAPYEGRSKYRNSFL